MPTFSLQFSPGEIQALAGRFPGGDKARLPTASVLLYCAFPDDYPILDVRALESLGVRPRSQYPVSFWLGYLETCRSLADQAGVSLRTLDKALWQYSKERSARSRAQ